MLRNFLVRIGVPALSAMLMASCSLLNAADDVLPGPGETGGGGAGQGGDPSTTSTSATMTGTSTSTSSAGGGGPTCGDGTIDADETCDPPASCPTQCDDGDSCTVEILQGDAASCTAACVPTTINECGPADGCCLPGCDPDADLDCMCGNGLIDPGETCDGNCPLNCDDGSSCSVDQQTGNATTCDVVCTHDPILDCVNDDGCCPTGCDVANDNNCGGTCVGNPQWQPVTCTTSDWVWTRDRVLANTIDAANASKVLATGCNHASPQPELGQGLCSLDGTGWVSTQTFVMMGCDATWGHLSVGGPFDCGGHDGDTWRHLVLGQNDCYAY